MRTGFIVEKTTKGCECMPFSVMNWDYKGEDYWFDLTNGMERCTVNGYIDAEGICPKCKSPVLYNEYLVVTE